MTEDILKAWKKTITNINNDEEILKELSNYLKENINKEEMINKIIDEYKQKIHEILKLTPGLSTGIMDINDNIKVNTYDGNISDIVDKKINSSTVFDASSMTKLFTVIMLLKEEEKGNIDLNKRFNDYSNILSNINIKIIDALRFTVDLKTDGRIDEKNLTIQEIKRRFFNTYIFKDKTFIYSDIPYMLIPFLFGKKEEEATENYLNIFYDTFKSIGLTQTGYSTINMTGGKITNNGKINTIFDPKARIFETKLGLVSGHAGVTTTVEDLEKLFIELSNGFINENSLKRLITQENNEIRATGVFINKNDISVSPISKILNKKSFAISGSTGTYAVFDLESGFMSAFLANIKSTTKNKTINTGNIYTFGDNSVNIPHNYETTVIGGTGTIKDGRIINLDGNEMTFFRATNNFKEEQIKTLIKLKFIKNYYGINDINSNILRLRR